MTQLLTGATESSLAGRLHGWDHLEWWVGNARAMTQFFMSGFGFRCTAYAGPETGVSDRASYLLEQGDIRFVVTAALASDSPVGAHVLAHGDGLRHLAWRVDDVATAFDAVVARGADPIEGPQLAEDGDGALITASVATYGETDHLLVDRSGYHGPFAPGFATDGLPATDVGPAVELSHIDHVVGNVAEGSLDRWVQFYETVFGFTEMRHFDAEQISTEYSALRSTVVWDGDRVVMPINEPAPGRRTSQIQEYLDTYGGPGVQHVALATPDIVRSVGALHARGVRFLVPPSTYYEDARRRCGDLDLPWATLEQLGILVDTDAGGYLLQVFTENLGDRPTVFFEIIQRCGASGFGDGNFKALFEAIDASRPAEDIFDIVGAVTDWLRVPDDSDFSLDNLPYGVVQPAGDVPRVGVAIGDHVLDLAAAQRDGLLDGLGLPAGLFASESLNGFLALGPAVWRPTRARLRDLLAATAPVPLLDRGDVTSLLPFEVADYVDFYSSEQHATDMGRMMRPGGDPLPPAWKRLPIGYHGRAATIVVSGTAVPRPAGLVPQRGAEPRLAPTACLDVEVELGFVVGVGNERGRPIPASHAAEHVFGAVLVNDWSARDIQGFESQPLGPFLGKSFATSISPWVVPLEALEPYRVNGPMQDPVPDPYLRCAEPRCLDIHLELSLNRTVISTPGTAALYWSMAQQLAHLTVNGATSRTGDLFATGTVSGPQSDDGGSLMELTWRGERPIRLADGTSRCWLEDSDTVTIRGWCSSSTGAGGRVGFGELTGTILPCPLP